MASSAKSVSLKMILEVIEDLGLSDVNDDKITHKHSLDERFSAYSTPDIELVYEGTIALTDGSATIDLTDLSDKGGNTIASTGKKVRIISVIPTSTNTGAITLSTGASNGYGLKGAGWSEALSAGQDMLFYANTKTPDIATDAKTIDLSGTAVESIDLLIVFG